MALSCLLPCPGWEKRQVCAASRKAICTRKGLAPCKLINALSHMSADKSGQVVKAEVTITAVLHLSVLPGASN